MTDLDDLMRQAAAVRDTDRAEFRRLGKQIAELLRARPKRKRKTGLHVTLANGERCILDAERVAALTEEER